MFLEYPSFSLRVEFSGSTPMGYLFLVTVENPGISDSVMLQIAPPPGAGIYSRSPVASFAAAGHKVVSDLRKLLSIGVDAFVDDRMRSERRVSRRDLEEAVEMADHSLAVARTIDERDLITAEKDIAEKMSPVGGIRRRRPGMGDAETSRSPGARQLAQARFTDIHEIVLTGKGPGLWYEATEPPPSWKSPQDWTPRAEPGERVLLLRQAPNIWHVFYRASATASGHDPRRALTGGLGDVIGDDAEMERYCNLVLAAPRRLAEDYSGLSEAQGQCFHERQQQT